jgi:hypothetical protein
MKKCKWEDGTEFTLEVGQVWSPNDPCDYTLKIVSITPEGVEVKQIETNEIYFHEFDGSDGFVDYLEQVFYTLQS